MSGIKVSENAGVRFVNIHDYSFKVTPTEEEKQAYAAHIITRTKESGVTVEELKFNLIEGVLKKFGLRETSFEPFKECYVDVQDEEGTVYRIALKYLDRRSTYVLTRLPNVREDLPIQIGVFKGTTNSVDAKGNAVEAAVVYIRQQNETTGEWEALPSAWPAPVPGEESPMPRFREFVGKGGKKEYDNMEQFSWLLTNSAKPYNERAGAIVEPSAPAPEEETPAPHASTQQAPPPPPTLGAKKPTGGQGFKGKPAASVSTAQKQAPTQESAHPEHIKSEWDDDLPF